MFTSVWIFLWNRPPHLVVLLASWTLLQAGVFITPKTSKIKWRWQNIVISFWFIEERMLQCESEKFNFNWATMHDLCRLKHPSLLSRKNDWWNSPRFNLTWSSASKGCFSKIWRIATFKKQKIVISFPGKWHLPTGQIFQNKFF